MTYAVTLSDGSGPFKSLTTFCVYTPVVTFTSTTTSAVVCPPASCYGLTNPAFAFGGYPSTGIAWAVNITTPVGGAGQFGMVQTVSSNRTRTTNPGGVVQTRSTNGAYALDATPNGTVQYFTSPVAASDTVVGYPTDSPGSGMSSSYQAYEDSDSFVDYAVYQPTGGIWVTLSLMSWSWSAGATLGTGTWTLSPGATNTVNPKGSLSTTFPSWSSNITSYSFH